MRMKRKDTQLLVENWRKVLKGEELSNDDLNEGFFGDMKDKIKGIKDKAFGQESVKKLLEKKLTSKLQKCQNDVAEKVKKLKKKNQKTLNKKQTEELVQEQHENIVDGYICKALIEKLKGEEDRKKVKVKNFNNSPVLDNLLKGKTTNKKFNLNLDKYRKNLQKTFNENPNFGMYFSQTLYMQAILKQDSKATLSIDNLTDIVSSMIK